MLTDMQAAGTWVSLQDGSQEPTGSGAAMGVPLERKWRQRCTAATGDITISRWSDTQGELPLAEATTPADRYFIAIALKTTRVKLSRGRQIIFDAIMPAGTLYVSAPSMQLSAQFNGPCDFLHFLVSTDHFASRLSTAQPAGSEDLNDLVLLRDPFAEQLAKALVEHDNAPDAGFARSVGQTLAMHLARLELPRAKAHALPKWRLRRVEEYVRANFAHNVGLSDLAKVAGLSRMHFAAQFRAATGYRPREYLLHQRVEQAKSLLSSTETPLVEIALAVGFCTQPHFSTIFKRVTGETPARWRCASKNELPGSPAWALAPDCCRAA